MICILQETRGTGVLKHLYQRRFRSHPISFPKKTHPQDSQTRTEKREWEMSYPVHTDLTFTVDSDNSSLEARSCLQTNSKKFSISYLH